MTIYESDTIIINGDEIAITNAETSDLINYLDQLPHWDFAETEPVARELCDRLDVDFDAYDCYDDLFDALVAKARMD